MSHNNTGPSSARRMAKCRQMWINFRKFFFTVKFKKNLQWNVNLKLPPPLKPVAALPCETNVKWSTITGRERQSINQSVSSIATLRPENRIANDMQLK